MSAAPAIILLVEDNPGDVLLARRAFRDFKAPQTLHVVSDGEEALAFLRREGDFSDAPRPDLVLLDINLPKLDGHEVLAAVKSDPDLCQIPVVMLTSSAREQDVSRSYAAHANSYITKPPDLKGLIKAVGGLEDYWFDLVRRPARPA